MTVDEVVSVVKRSLRTLTIFLVVGISAATFYYVVSPEQYRGQAILYVSSTADQSSSGAYDATLLSQQRVKSYSELLKSDRISQEVVARLGIRDSPQDFIDRISVNSTVDSTVLTVSVSASTPDGAATATNTTVDEFVGLVSELETPQVGRPPTVSIRVVQRATPPERTSSLGLFWVVLIGALIGFSLGVMYVVGRSRFAMRFATAEEVEQSSGLSVLGSITKSPLMADRQFVVDMSIPSIEGEEFRQLRTRMQYFDVDRPKRVLMVTSSREGEGKTTTLVNLGAAFAFAGQRVLLIDGDLRRPRVAEVLELDNAAGLSLVVSGRVKMELVIQRTKVPLLDSITAGPLPPNPAEILGSASMARTLTEAASHYDLVLVDTPPIGPVADALALSQSVDGVIFVVRSRETKRSNLASAMANLKAVGSPLLGAVFVGSSRMRSTTYSSYLRNSALGSESDITTLTDTRRMAAGQHGVSKPSPRPRS